MSERRFEGTQRFRIDRWLGEGAFGLVYLAYDLERGRDVALKLLRRADPDFLYRFKQEFRSLADLVHPNLVQLYELYAEEQHWFFTMEYVRGRNFLDYVSNLRRSEDLPTLPMLIPGRHADEPLAISTVVNDWRCDINLLRRALQQLAAGIHALHRAGKLHRDIKPANVLVTTEGRVVLLDFGMVKDLSSSGPTRSMKVVGTPAYMAPEQAAEQDVSPASDWYAVGVMLYEAMTGKLPYTGSTIELLRKKQTEDPPPPSEIASGVDEDLSKLCTELLNREASLRPFGEEIVRRIGVDRGTRAFIPAQPQPVPFVGRHSHLHFLREAFDESKGGRPVVILLHGGSGMGKTTLIRKFLEEVSREDPDVIVLASRCYEQESVPYKGLDSLMDRLSEHLQSLSRVEQERVIPRDVLALARLFPVLARASGVAQARGRVLEAQDSIELRRRAFGAAREMLARMADQRPVIAFIDDLQWSDLDSVALIADTMRPPDPPTLLWIAAYRSDELEDSVPLRSLVTAVKQTGPPLTVRELSVDEMLPDETEQLVLSLSEGEPVSTARAEKIARESGGNPFFVHELVRYREHRALCSDEHSCDRDSPSLQHVIRTRISVLPPTAQSVLKTVCVAGRPMDRGVLTDAMDIDGVSSAMDLLRTEHLIRTRAADTEEVEPYHARIADAVASAIPAEELREIHRRIAVQLRQSDRADPETLSFHFRQAGDPDQAAKYAVQAAEQAWQALAFDRAARLYRQVLEISLPSDPTLKVRLGDALANAGRGEESARAYLEAAEGLPPLESVDLRRRAVEQLLRSGRIDQGLAALRSVLAQQEMKLPASPRTALVSLIAHRLFLRLRGLEYTEQDASSISLNQLVQLDTFWAVALGLSVVDSIRGNDFQARHLLMALRVGEPNRIARALALEVGYSAKGGGRTRRQTQELIRRTTELVNRLHSPYALGFSSLTIGTAAYLEGRWQDAVELLQHSETILRESCPGAAQELDNARHFLLRTYFWVGDLNGIRARLPDLLKDAHERGDLYAATMFIVRNSYLLALAADDAIRAREESAKAIHAWPQAGFHTPQYIHLGGQTEADLYEGEGVRAWNRIQESRDQLRRSLILRVQFALIDYTHLHARCAIAAVLQSGDQSLLAEAKRGVKIIERENMIWGNALAGLLRAALASIKGDTAAAAQLLVGSEKQFESRNMALYAAIARRRRGELIGGTDGTALIRSSDEWMIVQHINDPEAFASMLVPGHFAKHRKLGT